MSTIIKGTRIYMTRGDTPTIKVTPIITATNTEYVLQAGDKIWFRLAQKPDMEQLLEKEVVSNELEFAVEDTADLAFGTYNYSLELVTNDGYHETFVEPTDVEGVFIIGEEIESHDSQ